MLRVWTIGRFDIFKRSVVTSPAKTVSNIFENSLRTKTNVQASNLPGFHYQSSVAFQLAKKQKDAKPKIIAEKISSEIKPDKILAKVVSSGKGFVNVRLTDDFLIKNLKKVHRKRKLVPPENLKPKRVIIDYSSPNIAKEMHVGHLRSTIIGDSISNIHEFIGDEVLRLNHVGDFGTQFGMLLAYLQQEGSVIPDSIDALEEKYRLSKLKFENCPDFQKKSFQMRSKSTIN